MSAAPAMAVFAKIATAGALAGVRHDPAPAHADFCSGQMLRKQANNMVIQYNRFINHTDEIFGKQADCRTAAADSHFGVGNAIDYRPLSGLQFERRAVHHRQFYFFAVGKVDDGSGHDKSISTGQQIGAADGKHL